MAGSSDRPEPLGFGNCVRCAYRDTGDAATCFTCASAALDPIDRRHTCKLCDGGLDEHGFCGNPLCNRTLEQRGWTSVRAIARRTGELERAINLYKFEDKYGWGWIFARVLVGWIEANRVEQVADVIIPTPTYVGPGGRRRDHTAYVIERAMIEAPRLPFGLGVMAKNAPSKKLSECSTYAERAQVAEAEIRPALEVLEPDVVSGKRVIVFDDVFTGGLTLREVAFKLRDAGARQVFGVALARQPFRGR